LESNGLADRGYGAAVRGDQADGRGCRTQSGGVEDDRAGKPGRDEETRGHGPAIFVGSVEQIREDIAACEKIGADEVFLELGFTHGGQTLSNWERLLEEFKPA